MDNKKDVIVQAVVKQHASLAALHKNSLNTIRIMTIILNDEVRVLSRIVRMGVNGNKVDNVSSGGLSCGMNSQGQLNEFAFYDNGIKASTHPQGAVFKECKIENIDKCEELVKDLANRIIGFSKLVSWDMSISESGEPILIEANLYVGGLDFHQMNNGPIFGDLTDDILKEVFFKKN